MILIQWTTNANLRQKTTHKSAVDQTLDGAQAANLTNALKAHCRMSRNKVRVWSAIHVRSKQVSSVSWGARRCFWFLVSWACKQADDLMCKALCVKASQGLSAWAFTICLWRSVFLVKSWFNLVFYLVLKKHLGRLPLCAVALFVLGWNSALPANWQENF